MKILWALFEPVPRLNIINGNKVNHGYLKNLQFFDRALFGSPHPALADDEMANLTWLLETTYPSVSIGDMFLCISHVKHQLQKGNCHHNHYEVWLMLLCCGDASSGVNLLCPIRRFTDGPPTSTSNRIDFAYVEAALSSGDPDPVPAPVPDPVPVPAQRSFVFRFICR